MEEVGEHLFAYEKAVDTRHVVVVAVEVELGEEV